MQAAYPARNKSEVFTKVSPEPNPTSSTQFTTLVPSFLLTSSARIGTKRDAVAVLLEHSVNKHTIIVTTKQMAHGSIPPKNVS